MGKGYYVSKNMGRGLLVLAACALVTIIALSIAYDKAKARNRGNAGDGATGNASVPAPSSTPFTPKEPWDHYRLPDSLAPISYNVTLWPQLDLNADSLYIFSGHSAVVFRCVKETDLILIHSNKLNLTTINGHHAKLTGLDGAPAPAIQKSWLVVNTEYLVLRLHSTLTVGKSYSLYTEFQGELADDLQGFYRSEYIEDGARK